MTPAALRAKFFPPARPICAFTREDIERMAREAAERAAAAKRAAYHKSSPQRIRRRREVFRSEDTGPVYIAAPPRDCKILALAATMYGVSVRDLIGPRRNAILTLARAYAAVRLRDELGRSYPQIGMLLRRDHTTIISLLGRLARNKARRIARTTATHGGKLPRALSDSKLVGSGFSPTNGD